MAVAVAATKPVRVAATTAVVVRVWHQRQQRDRCNTQQQHRKLGPARKGLRDVRPASVMQTVVEIITQTNNKCQCTPLIASLLPLNTRR